ncbi:3-oxoacyl-[acyl-carrier-protein] reductase [bacterium]|nr:MAG: 3-oxoacyl-[acyl-carrier-protein] reductase [bacterium]RKZ18171.1 MAG: 3-oxoacyl-[acyl-carrier-protein] reductase [bacterium]
MSDSSEASVVLVTGASQGIGRAIATRLSSEGFALALVARREEALRGVADGLDGPAEIYPGDVGDPEAASRIVAEVREKQGRIDGLVNNAGITRDSLLARMKPEQWREVMQVNLDGAYWFLRAVTPVFMRQKSGRVINITSVVGQMGNAGQVNYSASKAGMIGMTRAAARELASRGITVNAVAPGFIETEMTAEMPESAVNEMKARIPLQRLGSGEDVAASVAFLLSPDAAYITGQVINCDGGMVMA